ncbi:MAG: mannose-1-phosphate guanylyltransferase/mannose-6-phosphate isomerase [Casimicrobiaceae bacterium]
MIVPVILCGGAGTRLWPVSRESLPKPFMKLADDQSLLMKTYARSLRAVEALGEPVGEVLTVTNRDYYFLCKDELALLSPQAAQQGGYLLEPLARNTAPAIALAALRVAERHGPDAVLLVLPADHLIEDEAAFAAAVGRAVGAARQGQLVTFGITPTAPETGFGYIELGPERGAGVHQAVRFVEKPTREVAERYLASGRYCWNSGMFCFTAGSLLAELATHAPEVASAAQRCWEGSAGRDGALVELSAALFALVPEISIDYALMERSEHVAVVPAAFGWNDIGSWTAVRETIPADAQGNRALGEAVFIDAQDTFVMCRDRLVAAVGTERLMIIDTPDALLIAPPERAQDVKQVVGRLKQQGHEAYKTHRTVVRPWGTYTVLEEGPRFKIKRIEVRPGASLSLQMHHHRSEHWIVVSGTAKVVNGEQELIITTNQSTYIPAGQKHRLENPGKLDLVLIEVQSGEYLGEDDIVRFEDKYGRVG